MRKPDSNKQDIYIYGARCMDGDGTGGEAHRGLARNNWFGFSYAGCSPLLC